MESSTGVAAGKAGKPAAKKTTTKSMGQSKTPAKPRRTASRKTAVSRKSAGAAATVNPTQAVSGISDEQIRTRAYFIAEGRLKHGVAGDSDHDWLEAVRQLEEEAGQKRAS